MQPIILAVSGGVDSMVMLDQFKTHPHVFVAHFNHGTRPSAAADEEFVKQKAEEADLPIIIGRANLGAEISEASARSARYNFLQEAAKKHQAIIYTAHHGDDLIESIAINFIRGTGWRGLAPFHQPGVYRPFLQDQILFKSDILQYAAKNQITFRQDPTNTEDQYLRNRLRQELKNFPTTKKLALLTLHKKQSTLRERIENDLANLVPADGIIKRAWFNDLDEKTALEFLRACLSSANISLTRPQLKDFLHAIKTYTPEKSFNLPNDKLITIHKTHLTIKP